MKKDLDFELRLVNALRKIALAAQERVIMERNSLGAVYRDAYAARCSGRMIMMCNDDNVLTNEHIDMWLHLFSMEQSILEEIGAKLKLEKKIAEEIKRMDFEIKLIFEED